jgi:hypothetical protein
LTSIALWVEPPSRSTAKSLRLLFESGRLRIVPPPLKTQGSNAVNTRTPFGAIELGPKVIVDSCGVQVVGVDTSLILLLISVTIVILM